ncbi:alpha-N-acetylgalactosaminide alpha-2,6-sialyltransferase 1-like isoform X2 [Salarias fasciatus]|uniref:alpha-N-acetylgalactosaminide alpha-2,6-sialyltransferase 1-like isoform X2 n=1 Tax=Salarias fasciatus TaxID=181472 RepID=UPI00117666D5|nr:alpha-N-acetylgalactosaminide alpha-2,6-sialyltransferase 1-like isoform X2 [Salarias fasciatus]
MPLLDKKMFEKAPVWDFDDVYNQDAPPRPATCAQSRRNSKDEFFMKAFLPNVCLFLHKDSINMSEWNRLSHFNNPLGFMEYKYEDVTCDPVLKLIPQPKEPLLSPKPGSNGCVRCAVVGTGGILNGSKMGAEIDAHDYVFRMNGAITQGFEEDVGNRTSVYVHTAHSITTLLDLLKKYGYQAAPHDEGIKYVMIPEGQRDYNWLNGLLKGEKIAEGPYRNKEPRKFYSGQFNETRFYVLHQDFLRYVKNRASNLPGMAVYIQCFNILIALTLMLIFLSWEFLLNIHTSWLLFSSKRRAGDRFIEANFTIWTKGKPETPPAAAFTTQKANKTNLRREKSVEAEIPIRPLIMKSFRKLPKWNFDDVYNEDAPSWPTTCAKSLRKSRDEMFRKAFLPNIRLFLHKDNINVSEWNRLSHFNSPFGFMQYKYDEVMAAVKLIPKPTEPLLLPRPGGDGCVRCAVVGTGGILNGSRMGAEIEAHDYIFRVNGAMTTGFEADVGHRTSVYVHSAHSIFKSPQLLKKYGYKSAPHDEGIKYVMMPEAMKDFQWLEGLLKGRKVSSGPYHGKQPRRYYSGQYNESRFYVLHQDFLRYVRNRFLKAANLQSKHWPVVRPTNGAFTLLLALHTCDIVSAYGFMTDDYKKYSHYYIEKTKKKKNVLHPRHDYKLELNLWKKLHKRKIMTLYQRKKTQNH